MSTTKTTIYFDGACHLCAREIEMYRKVDADKQLEFVDISLSQFDATKEGLDPVDVHKNFHVKDTSGQFHKGVKAFQIIWDQLGIFRPLSWLYNQPVSSSLMDAGYKVFTKVRPLLPKKECESGACSVPAPREKLQ